MGDAKKEKPEGIPSNLMDAEQQEHLKRIEEKAKRLSRVAHAIEDILVKEGMTWGEWGEVVELFSTRIMQHVAGIKIKFIEEDK